MSATTETKIWLALKGRVETIPLAFPKAYPREAFTPPSAAPWLEIVHLPNANSRPFLGADDPMFRQGILQINLRSPVGKETGQAQPHPSEVDIQRAGTIAAHFWSDLTGRTLFFEGVRVVIQRAPDVARPFVDGAFWLTPISVRYEAFA